MATRTVSTKLAIDGESEYRAAITRINAELKNMQSALRLTESEYKNNANSMAALSAKGEALSRLHESQKAKVDALRSALENARNAQQTYAQKSEELRAKIQANNEALDKLKSSTGDTTAEEEKLTKENEALTAELAENEKYLAAAEKGANSWQTQLNNAEVQLNELDSEIKENDKLLDEAKDSADGCAHSIDEFGNEVKESSDAIDELANALAAAGLAKTAKEIAEALKECVDSAVAFEAAMAGVKRTVGGGDDFIAALGDRFKELSTVMPITTSELAKIAETAGQLGIRQENVEQFTTVMAKLATTTDLTADNAATMLAQFANITGITDYERLGAVVASLGDSTATTASKVVDMSQGMAAAASIAGMSERDILAIAAAVGSLGIEAQAGSTAMSTLISTLYKATETGGEKLEAFASVAGMTAEEFQRAWQDDAVTALDAFIRGLNDTERNGKSAILVLNDLGITNVRQTKAILGLASAGDLLTGTIAQANRAWNENTALNEKAAIMYETTEAKITMYKNSVDNLKIAIGDQLTPALGNLAEKGTDVVSWAAKMVEENQWLAPAITAVATALGVFTAVLGGSIAVIKVVIPAIKALNLAMAANPYILVAAAITAVVSALVVLAVTLQKTESEYDKLSASSKQQYDEIKRLNAEYERACEVYGETSAEAQLLKKQIDDATAAFNANKTTMEEVTARTDDLLNKQEELNAAYSEVTATVDKHEASYMSLFNRLQELMGIEHKTVGTKQEILAIVELLNDAIPELGLAYDDYTDSLNMTADGIMRVIEAELKAERYQANHDALLDAMRQRIDMQTQIEALQTEVEAATQRLTDAIAARDAAEAEWGNWKYLAYDAYTQSMMGYWQAVNTAQQEVNALTEQQQALGAAFEENEANIEELSASYADLGSSAEESASAEEQAADRVKSKLQELAQAYKDAYDSARESLDGQIGLWDEMDNEAVTSAETLQRAVDSQITYLQNYSANLDSLLSRNIEGIEAFARNFTDGSEESAAALAGLAAASDDEIRQIMASMAQVDTYKDSLASLFATLETDLTGSLETIKNEYAAAIEEISGTGANVDFSAFIDAVDAAFSDVGVTFQTIGSDAGNGLAAGISASSGEASSQATAMAQAVVDAVRTALDSHSPSVVMDNIGQGVGEGLAQGIDKNASKVTSSAEKLGQQLTDKMTAAGKDSVRGFMQEFDQITSQTQAAMNSMRQAAISTASGLPGAMQGIGAQMISGMVNGLYSNAGSLYAAITSIVNNAIARAQAAAATHSPSKKTEEIFENVGEGMVVGIEKKRERVATATQGVVDNALSIDTSGVMEAAKLLKTSAPDLTSLLAPAHSAPLSNDEGDIEIEVNIEHMEVRSEADIKAVSKQLGQDIKQELRRRGRL